MPNILTESIFHRRFSINPYKSLRLALGSFDCHKDWISTDRGAPYPLVYAEGDLTETVNGGRYSVRNRSDAPASAARLLGLHFPFSTYEMTFSDINAAAPGGAGFRIYSGKEGKTAFTALAGINDGKIGISCRVIAEEKTVRETRFLSDAVFTDGTKLLLTFRPGAADIYLDTAEHPEYVASFSLPEFEGAFHRDEYINTYASVISVLAPGENAAFTAQFYLDGGISQADPRCVCYEDGTPIIENGRVFLTFSARMHENCYQGVASWCPTTAELRMEGAVFFDAGDGFLCGDVASSLKYDRRTKKWLIWACSFSHGHILCHGSMSADPRFGISILDAELMNVEMTGDNGLPALSDDRVFAAKSGDEDPDFIYDEKKDLWRLAVCRITETEPGRNEYRYFLFEGPDPFSGYTYTGQTAGRQETGGSFVTAGGQTCLVCGARFDKKADYSVHPLSDLSESGKLRFDYDDGGFRGWGTVIPYPVGNRLKYYLFTFDRHNGSLYNWSYGNLYVFESDRYEKV